VRERLLKEKEGGSVFLPFFLCLRCFLVLLFDKKKKRLRGSSAPWKGKNKKKRETPVGVEKKTETEKTPSTHHRTKEKKRCCFSRPCSSSLSLRLSLSSRGDGSRATRLVRRGAGVAEREARARVELRESFDDAPRSFFRQTKEKKLLLSMALCLSIFDLEHKANSSSRSSSSFLSYPPFFLSSPNGKGEQTLSSCRPRCADAGWSLPWSRWAKHRFGRGRKKKRAFKKKRKKKKRRRARELLALFRPRSIASFPPLFALSTSLIAPCLSLLCLDGRTEFMDA
jgi:hypothetical protein